MFRTIRVLIFSQFIVVNAHAWSIEDVSGPRVDGLVNSINRYSVHHEGDEVHYGRCEETEVRCLPNSESYVLRRKVSYDEYQNYLARTFDVDPRYLKNHEKQALNFKSLTTTLQQILDADGPSREEKDKAREKFDTLTQKGGIVDRFTQAVAIKRSLEWDPANPEANLVTFERSQRQFRQSLQPMDFASDLKIEDPTVAFEPSTERSWHFAGNDLTRREAEAACEKKGFGYHLPDADELRAAPWIFASYLVDAVAVSKADKAKMLWLNLVESNRRESGRRIVAQFDGQQNPPTVIDFTRYARFNLAKLTGDARNPIDYRVADVSTGGDHPENLISYVDAFGNQTPKYSALCVKETGEAF